MSMSRRSIFGVFDDAGTAEKAIDALQDAGFSRDQIHSSKSTSSGGFLAGLKSMFTGESGGTTGGAHDLTDTADIPDQEAKYYEQEHEAGRVVVAVRAGGRQQEAATIMRQMGAYDYNARDVGSNRGQAMGAAGTSGDTMRTGAASGRTMDTTDVTADTTQARARRDPKIDPVSAPTNTIRSADTDVRGMQSKDAPDADEARKLKLREEQLDVTKERVQTGEVGIRKEVVTEEKSINVPVTHEEVYIERHPVSGEGGDVTTPLGEGESIRVPVSEERVNVNKDTIVTGEVSIGKRAVEGTQQVTDTVRHEEARVARKGDTPMQGGLKDDRLSDATTDDAPRRDMPGRPDITDRE